MKKPLVILLHGIFRTSMSMTLFNIALRLNGFSVLNITYPSLRHDLKHLADITAAKILKSGKIEQAEDIHFVTHSMGGLLVRYILNAHTQIGEKTRSIVMLVPPNKGSEMADFVHRTRWTRFLYRLLYGPAGQQLTTDHADHHPSLDCKVGIISGSRGSYPLSRYVFKDGTPHDGLISHERMKLDETSTLFDVPTSHTAILCSPAAIRATLDFLLTGSFSGPPRPPAAPEKGQA